ncbi:hypothetical protein EGB31_23640 [Salmonella enterica]|uniref:Trimeric autotransporter adhesin YadA-like C-terminal membrane anchor domain-containing protein n=1 Tax=Salmonella enterica TaxID=28901 RepID=A0A5V4LH56_SALER|nr:hypothetical protein [Salmonella enterica]EDC7984109.1 hypothetical protein [Salmonella enterica subsp. enterica serovar Montevideo]EAP4622966.1 hypothetical protein [Salmonella enterica]EAR0904472.1 hypothetical protein [Salmonella enterica]EBI9027846.1 hypothetical protein [Salmonella enterica]
MNAYYAWFSQYDNNSETWGLFTKLDLRHFNSGPVTDRRFGEINQNFRGLSNKLARAENRLNAGIAGVAAVSAIPYVAEGRFSWGQGPGNYQNGNAMAAGMQMKSSANTRMRLNVSWDSQHNTSTGIGLAGSW